MSTVLCENCNKKVNYTVEERNVEKYKGKTVNVIENVAICNNCGAEIFIPTLEEENLKRLYEKYRKMTNLITPQEIINFRNKYDISQRELLSILGWGKMTINRYERGALPSQSHSDYLKLLINDEALFYECVKRAYKETAITEKTYNKIIRFNENDTIQLELKILNKKLKHDVSIYTGFKKFDLNKLENIISYIADKVDNLYKTSLNKYLFYIDFLCYKENSLSITGLRYVKEQFGPVIEQKGYEDIINVLNNKIDKSENFGYDYSIITKIKSKKNYDISILKDYEIKVINRVINKLNTMNCTQISELSHEEAAWKFTSKGKLITYDYADDLLI